MNHLLALMFAIALLIGCGQEPSLKSEPAMPETATPSTQSVAKAVNLATPAESSPVDIWTAARNGNIETIREHIASGTDLNAKDEILKVTPLFLASSKGHLDIVQLLIESGADLNARDKYGNTPLDVADNRQITTLLLESGAKKGRKMK